MSGIVNTTSIRENHAPPPVLRGESYANTLSKNFSGTIKSAITENIQLHKKADIENSTFLVYGSPEEGQDYTDLHDLLAFLSCPGYVVHHEKIGCISNHKPTVRPIKEVLRSANDREFILRRTYLLRRDTYCSGAYISLWLSQNELNKLKLLRHRCQDLNKASPANKKGRKPYAILSDKLMKRGGDGKLTIASDSVASSSALNVRNNAPADSQKKVIAHSKEVNQNSGAQHLSDMLSSHSNSKKRSIGGHRLLPSSSY